MKYQTDLIKLMICHQHTILRDSVQIDIKMEIIDEIISVKIGISNQMSDR